LGRIEGVRPIWHNSFNSLCNLATGLAAAPALRQAAETKRRHLRPPDFIGGETNMLFRAKSLAVFSVLMALIIALCLSAGSASAQTAEAAAKERQALMKNFGSWSKTLVASSKSGTADAETAKAAEDISANMKKIPSLFPAGSGLDQMPNGTRAKPDIWANFDKFQGYAKDGDAAFAEVASAAKAGNGAAVTAAFTKASAVCSSCHRDFRGPEVK
jgi:cytochrome c556